MTITDSTNDVGLCNLEASVKLVSDVSQIWAHLIALECPGSVADVAMILINKTLGSNFTIIVGLILGITNTLIVRVQCFTKVTQIY